MDNYTDMYGETNWYTIWYTANMISEVSQPLDFDIFKLLRINQEGLLIGNVDLRLVNEFLSEGSYF